MAKSRCLKGKIIMCPRIMVGDIKSHFEKYFTNLKNPTFKSLRKNFDLRYKFILGF